MVKVKSHMRKVGTKRFRVKAHSRKKSRSGGKNKKRTHKRRSHKKRSARRRSRH